MPPRTIRILGFAVLGSVLAGLALLGLAAALVTCYDYPFTTRDHPPSVPVLTKQAGAPIQRTMFQLPIVDDPLVPTDQRTVETERSVEEVLAFYQQQLVAEGWETDYTINPITKQMFILNKQACPYYGLGITTNVMENQHTLVTLDPYVKDRCDCN
jgi:hypothetical protein